MDQEAARERWGSRRAFVLAAIGSAVGLGNMWRFSYLTAESGGAAFLLLYVALTLVVGIPLLLAELALGRRTGAGPVRALVRAGGRRWRGVGWCFVAGVAVLLSYYGVVGGWTLRYAAAFFAGQSPDDPAGFFDAVASGPGAALAGGVFLAMTAAVVARGVRAGIEQLTTILLPLLVVMVGGLAAYAATLDGAAPAYEFLLRPDFTDLEDPRTWSRAVGQTFFSLSLGMGAMLTFGSYLSRAHPLPGASVVIAGADFAVALLAGLLVFPLLFAFGLESQVSENAMGALFIAVPSAFLQIGEHGAALGGLFFTALVIGAWTSAVAMLEVVVSAAREATGWSRARLAWGSAGGIGVLGLAPALDLDVLGWMDRLAGEFFVLAGGLALSVFVGWVMEHPTRELRTKNGSDRWLPLWHGAIRVVVPAALVLLLWGSLQARWLDG